MVLDTCLDNIFFTRCISFKKFYACLETTAQVPESRTGKSLALQANIVRVFTYKTPRTTLALKFDDEALAELQMFV